MMADRYHYLVEVRELKSRLGKFRFAAKVTYIMKNPGENSERINPGFEEYWGVTDKEAEGKARAEADRWISKQQNSESSARA
jgi:hypothetical protein